MKSGSDFSSLEAMAPEERLLLERRLLQGKEGPAWIGRDAEAPGYRSLCPFVRAKPVVVGRADQSGAGPIQHFPDLPDRRSAQCKSSRSRIRWHRYAGTRLCAPGSCCAMACRNRSWRLMNPSSCAFWICGRSDACTDSRARDAFVRDSRRWRFRPRGGHDAACRARAPARRRQRARHHDAPYRRRRLVAHGPRAANSSSSTRRSTAACLSPSRRSRCSIRTFPIGSAIPCAARRSNDRLPTGAGSSPPSRRSSFLSTGHACRSPTFAGAGSASPFRRRSPRRSRISRAGTMPRCT